ncbi:cutinase [Mycobacterium tuberculosis]|nr:cutinase [Mycobacterium tuberculosis]
MIPRPQPHSGRWRAGAARRLTSLVAAAFAAATLLLTPALAPPASAAARMPRWCSPAEPANHLASVG